VKIVLGLLSLAVSLLGLIAVLRAAKTQENKENTERPHSQDVPALGWVVIAIATVGLPALLYLHDRATRPHETESWWVLGGVGVFGFVMAAVGVISLAVVGGGFRDMFKAGLDADDPSFHETVSPMERWVDFILGGLTIAYGIHGLWINDLYIPASNHGGTHYSGAHLHGIWAVTLFTGYLALIASVTAPLVFQNDGAMRKYSRICMLWGLALTMIGIVGGMR
jgi:hypothetical protein